jgi:hypothetical protein
VSTAEASHLREDVQHIVFELREGVDGRLVAAKTHDLRQRSVVVALVDQDADGGGIARSERLADELTPRLPFGVSSGATSS